MSQYDATEGTATRLPDPEPFAHPQSDAEMQDEEAAVAVSLLYQATALGLIRLAYVILGDRQAAEDVVQEAFFGLFRRWDRLSNVEGAEYYVRVSVLNGCRSALRHRTVLGRHALYELPAPSADAAVLGNEERAELIRGIEQLPMRQREAIVLRYYLDLPDNEIATLMGISPSTVRSTVHRALESVGRKLKERP